MVLLPGVNSLTSFRECTQNGISSCCTSYCARLYGVPGMNMQRAAFAQPLLAVLAFLAPLASTLLVSANGWALTAQGYSCYEGCPNQQVHLPSMKAVDSEAKFRAVFSDIAGAGESTGICNGVAASVVPIEPSYDPIRGSCYFVRSDAELDATYSDSEVKRICCCRDTPCPIPEYTTTPAPATTTLAHLGWTLAAKGDSCSASCAAQNSACHELSLKNVNTFAEFVFALAQAGKTDVVQAIDDEHMCFFPEPINPSVVRSLPPRSVQYNGESSTCDAVPTGEYQRLCCCSITGCATSA
jgi:hypothetical protein